MGDEEAVSGAAIAICRQFDIPETASLLNTANNITYEQLLQILAERLRYLIDREWEHFLWVLYRIDVSEEQVKKVIAESPMDSAPEAIAELIIQRQLEKVRTKNQYRKGPADWSFDIDDI